MVQITPFRWQRWTALVIVTWALMDLTVPGLCPTELGQLESKTPSSRLFTANADPRTIVTPLISAITSPAPGDEQPGDDDCWCCSSHVAPAPLFHSTKL